LNTKDNLKILGENINRQISISGFKQTEIAEKLNVTAGTVSRWVSGGRIPTAKNLIELANILNVDVVEFWKDLKSQNVSSEYRQILKNLNQLTESQLTAVSDTIKSMLPPPEIKKFLNDASQLSDEDRKAFMTLMNTVAHKFKKSNSENF